jgi:sodium/hydrogen antiporter
VVELLVLALSVFGYSLVSARLSMSPITAPMVFTTVGIAVGAAGVGWFDVDLDVNGEAVSILVEATLVLVLFTDAIRIDLRSLRTEGSIPARLLGIGLPLTIVAGTAAALGLLPGLEIGEAALIAAVLAPTDAALGQAVVSDRRLPVRLRQSLNVESGLNDGIALPVVTIFLALSAAESEPGGFSTWGEFAAKQIGFGLLAGLIAGMAGGWLLQHQAVAQRIDGVYRQLATISIAVAAFAAADLVGGNGFIAAFTAGVAFGTVARDQCHGVQDFTEDEGELLTVITFTVFGAALIGPVLDDLTWRVALYALLSLTVVRIVPVLIALWGSGLLLESRLFVGWFGPRGLASILFGLLVIEELEGAIADEIFLVVAWTVLLSVFAHGLSAAPWTSRLSRRLAEGHDAMAERRPAPEMPTRRRLT